MAKEFFESICRCLELNLQSPRDYVGKYILRPFDIGDGRMLGNVLRRILLTRIPGLHIIGVRFAQSTHEFNILQGVVEDTFEIGLNLKDLIFMAKVEDKEPGHKDSLDFQRSEQGRSFGRIKVQGPAIVTAGDIYLESGIQCVDSSQYIATISDPSILEMELELAWGTGYHLEEEPKAMGEKNGFLKIDNVFMPVQEVGVKVQEILYSERPGEPKEKKEELILEIVTNGSITPSDALLQASLILDSWFSFNTKMLKRALPTVLKEERAKDQTSFMEEDLPLERKRTTQVLPLEKTKLGLEAFPIEELKISKRSYNALKAAKVDTLGKLLSYSLIDLKKIKNLGQKSVQEIIETLKVDFNLSFK